ncbi:hypothetical protein F5877DRAFT_86655 [Lentinula edodes]|nr:hypothetical protein F5877DRAFT_86655 [Lentinula edodes]
MLPAKYRPSLHATYTLLHLIVATTVRWDPEFVPELACSYGECAMPCTELTRAVLQQLGLPAIVTLIWIRTSPQRMRRLHFRGGTIRIGLDDIVLRLRYYNTPSTIAVMYSS